MGVLKQIEEECPAHFKPTFDEFYNRIEARSAFKGFVKPSLDTIVGNAV